MKIIRLALLVTTLTAVIILTTCPAPLEPGKLALLQNLDSPVITITSPIDYSECGTVIELAGYINSCFGNADLNTYMHIIYLLN